MSVLAPKTPAQASTPRRWREITLILTPLLTLIGIHLLDPIAQDPSYHVLADTRPFLGVPNFWNVVSNLAFLIFGAFGLRLWWHGGIAGSRTAWATFFGGVALVSIASGYYHLTPTNTTLVWDRLPITLAFMGLFVAVLDEHIGASLGRYLLLPAVLIGAASLGWWHYADDLRFYIWVQAAPLLTIPLALALFEGRYTDRAYLLYGLGLYLLAKVVEFQDAEIYTATAQTISGHSVKHVLASLAALCVYLMLRQRRSTSATA